MLNPGVIDGHLVYNLFRLGDFSLELLVVLLSVTDELVSRIKFTLELVKLLLEDPALLLKERFLGLVHVSQLIISLDLLFVLVDLLVDLGDLSLI